MTSYSEVTKQEYENEDAVFFRNLSQSAYYVSLGATILDVFVDSKMKLVFVFSKEEHNRLIHKWNARKFDN